MNFKFLVPIALDTGQNLMTFFLILGDDSLQLEELERVMGECLRESGLELPEIDVQVNIDH